jgi:hypothetical protein
MAVSVIFKSTTDVTWKSTTDVAWKILTAGGLSIPVIISGAYKSAVPSVLVGGAWKEVTAAKILVGGVWKDVG